MKKVAKLTGIVSRPLQTRYLAATAEERRALRPVIEAEREWMIEKMTRKGYRLEAVVADVFGVFARGPAQGTVELVSPQAHMATSS